jgi:hypothetical protein
VQQSRSKTSYENLKGDSAVKTLTITDRVELLCAEMLLISPVTKNLNLKLSDYTQKLVALIESCVIVNIGPEEPQESMCACCGADIQVLGTGIGIQEAVNNALQVAVNKGWLSSSKNKYCASLRIQKEEAFEARTEQEKAKTVQP